MLTNLSNKQLVIYLLLILFCAFLFGCVSLIYPYGRDQGTFAYIGKLILEGKIQYKDAFDIKPPGVHFIFAFGQMLFGDSMVLMRLFDVLWQMITAIVIFFIVQRITGSKWLSFASSFLYLFLYFRIGFWDILQAEGFLNFFFALSVLLILKCEDDFSNVKFFFSGVFFGLSVLFKTSVLIYLPFILFFFFFEGRKSLLKKFKDAFYLITGLLSVFILTVLFYFINSALGYFAEIQFIQVPLYVKIGYENESLSYITSNTIRLFVGSVYSPLILLSYISFFYLFKKRAISWNHIVILIWLTTSILGLIIQWKFFIYHFLLLIPPLVIGSVLLVKLVLDDYYIRFSRLTIGLISVASIVYFLLAFKPYWSRYGELIDVVTNKVDIREHYVKVGITADKVFRLSQVFEVSSYIKNNTSENDKVFIWNLEPLLYYLSGRACVSRFIVHQPLCWKYSSQLYRIEFMSAINSTKPKLIIVATNDPMEYLTGFDEDSEKLLSRFPEFKRFIDENYRHKTTIEDTKIFELKN